MKKNAKTILSALSGLVVLMAFNNCGNVQSASQNNQDLASLESDVVNSFASTQLQKNTGASSMGLPGTPVEKPFVQSGNMLWFFTNSHYCYMGRGSGNINISASQYDSIIYAAKQRDLHIRTTSHTDVIPFKENKSSYTYGRCIISSYADVMNEFFSSPVINPEPVKEEQITAPADHFAVGDQYIEEGFRSKVIFKTERKFCYLRPALFKDLKHRSNAWMNQLTDYLLASQGTIEDCNHADEEFFRRDTASSVTSTPTIPATGLAANSDNLSSGQSSTTTTSPSSQYIKCLPASSSALEVQWERYNGNKVTYTVVRDDEIVAKNIDGISYWDSNLERGSHRYKIEIRTDRVIHKVLIGHCSTR